MKVTEDAGIDDLHDLRNRYIHLKTNIATIIKRLRESNCINLSDEEFDNGMISIIKYLKSAPENKNHE